MNAFDLDKLALNVQSETGQICATTEREKYLAGDARPDYLERLIDERVAGEFLGYKVQTLRNWRLKGDGPPFVRVNQKAIRYRRKDLIAWADSRLVSSTSESLP